MGGVVALLAEARAAGLTVRADGDRLVIRGPRRCAELAQSILARKPDVMAALAEWGDAAAAVAWFGSWCPPAEPFQLKPGITILDPRRWQKSIAADIAQGPSGPRARYGALQDDLRRLHGLRIGCVGGAQTQEPSA
ncbi:MAG: hypothetical protein V3W34_19805 [Phycisphaerae bacterium]